MNQNQTDERWMRLALSLGQRGLGRVWPNPAVGCVIVKNETVVGRGWTQPGGRPHAEVHALRQAGAKARGATVYVTLEPCAHTGQSGPCANALVTAGVSCVVSATTDPDNRVAGKGHEILRQAGVAVREGVLGNQAFRDHLGFFNRVLLNRPMVTLKLASSLDGRIATKTGDSRWVTGPIARQAVHLLRATHDAILVGRETAEVDDPDLTVRGMGLESQSPVRVVLDTKLKLSPANRMAATSDKVPVWVCHGPDASTQDMAKWANSGVDLLDCNVAPHGLDLKHAMSLLADRGITRLFVEGGGQVAASFLRAGLVDQLVQFNAGIAIGSDGRPNLGALGIETLSMAPRFERTELKSIGADVMSVWVPRAQST